MKNRSNNICLSIGSLLLICVFFLGCGCSQSQRSQQQVIERVRSEVAEILGKEASKIDVIKPLIDFGADELDVVEIVMAVEEAFDVEIPDSAIAKKPEDIAKTLTVQKLAEIVANCQRTKDAPSNR